MQSLAEGDKLFLESMHGALKHLARERTVSEAETGDLQLRELQVSYDKKIFRFVCTVERISMGMKFFLKQAISRGKLVV